MKNTHTKEIGKSVNISDVARHAGVSAMTVSRVINGEVYVREATKKRVVESIRALNYKPNHFARALAGRRTYRVALLYGNPSAFYLSELLVAALEEISKHGHQLLVHKLSEKATAAAIEKSLSGLLGEYDGVIVPAPFADFGHVRDFVLARKLPAVFLSSFEGHGRTNKVCIDDLEAAKEMTEHLIGLGHQRIGFIKGPAKHYSSGERLLGYRQALSENELIYSPDLVRSGQFTHKSGFSAAQKLLSQTSRPTAIFAANDDMAAGVISYAASEGLDVPSDLSVVGFDDSPVASAIHPRLTTIRQPLDKMAASAVKMLVKAMNTSTARQGTEDDVVKIPYRIVFGASTAKPG